MLQYDEEYGLHFGDCIPHLAEMPESSVDFSVFSPPFPQMFSYSALESDLGNSEELGGEMPLHFSFFFRGMLRVMKPGRVMLVHCAQLHRRKADGDERTVDFRGTLIRLAKR